MHYANLMHSGERRYSQSTAGAKKETGELTWEWKEFC